MMYNDAFLARLGRLVGEARGRWDFGPDSRVELLNISENATYLLSEGGRRMILRVHRPGYHTLDEIKSELAWIEALRASGTVETPKPIRGRDGELLQHLGTDGEARVAVGFDFVTGHEPKVDGNLPEWFRELGRITARMHGQVRGWTLPPGFQRKVWNFDAALGRVAYWGDWREGPGLDAQGRALLQRTADRIERETAALGTGPEHFGLVHADLRLANLVVEGDRMTVIDFDDCGFSWLVYDFAAAITFLEHEPVVPELMESWVRGYRDIAPLSPTDEAAIPTMVMMRRILILAWIASHAETPTAKAMGTTFTKQTLELAEAYLSRAETPR
ncbi:MAG: phosphotransferase enzyme family protein [Alphaproteobacteria bacterium]